MKHTIKRIFASILLFFIVSSIVFTLIRLQPGNPFASMVTVDTDPELMERKMIEYGLYDPIPIQYIKWLGRIICGDMGYSIQYKVSVSSLIKSRMMNSILLCGSVFLLTLILACLLGVYSAKKPNGLLDRIMTILSFTSVSIPSFFIALLLIKLFSFDFQFLPPSGIVTAGSKASGINHILDILYHMILPVGILTLVQTSHCIRYVRASMIDVLHQDYIHAVQTKGIGENRILWIHGFRNALPTIINLFSMQLPNLISGTVLTETVFVWPGIGRLSYESILSHDYPVTMGVTLVISFMVIVSNLFADILSHYLDPRQRRGGRK